MSKLLEHSHILSTNTFNNNDHQLVRLEQM